jgi:hypothetical protein
MKRMLGASVRSTLVGLAASAMLAASCGGGAATTTGSGGGGGATRATNATTSTSAASSGAVGSTTTGGTGGAGGAVATPRLVVPAVIDLPYAVAGQGGTTVMVTVANDGDAPLDGLTWKLTGDAAITLGTAPASLAAGASAQLVLDYAGSSIEAIATATLAVTAPSGSLDIPVFAAAGDAALGDAAWEDVLGPGGVVCGSGATVAMPAAPYPDGASAYTDPSVRVFLPDGYRDRGAQDVVLHFHGFNATVAETLGSHLFQEHVYASGANAVLVVPQGPVNAASGDFGKLMSPGGLAHLLTEVMILLYREGKVTHPALGALALTSHSGGYQGVAVNLDPANLAPPVAQLDLFDSIYGYESTFEAFALGGGALRSNYTLNGGTLSNNQAVAAYLAQKGEPAATVSTQRTLGGAAPVIYFAASTHDGSTRIDGAYGESLRWKLPHARRGPRIELREASAQAGMATLRWLAPADEDVTGFVVERSPDGVAWSVAATTGAAASSASFALTGGARVRVKAVVTGVDAADVLPSDTYRVDAQPGVLVVDGFDRLLDGGFGGLHHDFAAVVGEGAGPVASVSHRAITEDGFDLAGWPAVLWLLGDQSTDDHALTAAEQQALLDYVDAGGRLVISGSELGWDIGQTSAGADFLAQAFSAAYVADNSGSHAVAGAGPLAAVTTLTFGGASGPYLCAYPDVLAADTGGTVLLRYGNNKPAAVGVAGRAAWVGFPLELIDAPADRAAVVNALLTFVGG